MQRETTHPQGETKHPFLKQRQTSNTVLLIKSKIRKYEYDNN